MINAVPLTVNAAERAASLRARPAHHDTPLENALRVFRVPALRHKARQVRTAVRRAVVYHKRTGDPPNRGDDAGL